MLASTKTRGPSGRSSSFIHILFQDHMNHSRIGGNNAKCGLGDTRLPAPLTPRVFGWRDEDFHLRPIGHRERFFQDDHTPLYVSFISHSRVSSVDASLARVAILRYTPSPGWPVPECSPSVSAMMRCSRHAAFSSSQYS